MAISPGESVQFLRGVGPDRARLFEKLGVYTLGDLLYFFPRDYVDLRSATPIDRLATGRVQVVQARLEFASSRTTRVGGTVVQAAFADPGGYLSVVWFNRPDVLDNVQLEQECLLTGKVELRDGRRRMTNPMIAPAQDWSSDNPTATLTPIYSLTEGLHADAVREAVRRALAECASAAPDVLPSDYRRGLRLPAIGEALSTIHFPKDRAELAQARRRLVFDEFFILQTALALRRAQQRAKPAFPITVTPKIDARIRRLFPFRLTQSQEHVIHEVVTDLAHPNPMYRLLQGDVGSGKTAVAVYALLSAVANGYQAALIAPTEVLARQHYQVLDEYLSQSRVRRTFLAGSMPAKERESALERLSAGEIDLVVGTHAVLQESVAFANLALVVIDEQQKFGVRQRAAFQHFATVPHQLVMTATPMPRSLAMTWFGDLDLSELTQKPPGRKETLTYVVPTTERDRAYTFLCRQAATGVQGIVVCPRIDDDKEDAVHSVESMAAELSQRCQASVTIGVIHGRLAERERAEVIERFRSGQVRILISTVVVEVGIDVPAAQIAVIENAERFGLAQLHQLRGRVGRADRRGVCFLMNASSDPAVGERLRQFASMTDGFQIADLDARLRGIGQVVGSHQHGFHEPHIGSYSTDRDLLELARGVALRVLQDSAQLTRPEWAPLRDQVVRRYGQTLDLATVG